MCLQTKLSCTHRDLQKRPTKETYKRDSQKSLLCVKRTHCHICRRYLYRNLSCTIRPTKETYKRDQQKSSRFFMFSPPTPSICAWSARAAMYAKCISIETCHVRKETYKRDLQKKPTKETYKKVECVWSARAAMYAKCIPKKIHPVRKGTRDSHERPTKETYKRDLQKRPTKETYKGDLQKRPTKETHKRDLQKRLSTVSYKRDSQKCPMCRIPVACQTSNCQ